MCMQGACRDASLRCAVYVGVYWRGGLQPRRVRTHCCELSLLGESGTMLRTCMLMRVGARVSGCALWVHLLCFHTL